MRLMLLLALIAFLPLVLACSASRGPSPGAAAAAAAAPSDAGVPEPPAPRRDPVRLEKHGHVRVDDYFWLKERDNPEVLAYLEAENEYLEAAMVHTEGLQETLYEEIVGRLVQDDASVPFRRDGFDYYWRYPEGGEYRIYCRREGSPEAPEEILVDGNAEAEGHDFFSLRGLRVSSGGNLLAYAVDTVGRRLYTLKFRDLRSGEDLPDEIPGVTGNSAWANDDRTIFYTRQHPETLRWYRVYRHVVGTDPADDVLVYEEKDEEFSTYVYKTKSERFVVIGSEQTLSSEMRYLEANDPEGELRLFQAREPDHEYRIDHFEDRFLVRTNWQARNFRLMETPLDDTAKQSWRELIPHREEVYLGAIEVFRRHLVVSERADGLIRMRVRPWDGGEEHYIDFGEPAYDAYFDDNYEIDSGVLRYGYTSLTTPESIFDYDLESRERTLLKEQPVLGGFDKTDYVTERLHAPAGDGTRVPISIVYRRGFPRDGSRPLLLYGYGSYGASIDASFSSSRLSLLDRGFAFAIAHVRGGQELGRAWYEAGKLMRKKNTFTDFIDCARFLIEEGYAAPDLLFAQGGSAGGLLMGAVVNMAPELFRGVVSRVPFVDVVTTMLDPDIPLTTSEYDEWGDPNDPAAYDYILSYSPYDNLEEKDYPAMLVTTGLQDSQVQYWEPAKYVAKLRSVATGDGPVYLYTNLGAGHGGASGRFKRHRETALAYAFLLDQAGGAG